MEKLDTHQHFWNLQKFQYPWLTSELVPLYRNFDPTDLEPLLKEAGINGTVLVQATHSTAETEWLLEQSASFKFIRGVVGWLDLSAYNFVEQLEELKDRGPLVGLRHQVHDEPDPEWLLQNKIIRGLRLLAARDFTYDLLVKPVHLKSLPALFEAVPHGRWIIDHIAKPDIKSGQIEPWLKDLKRVSHYPNVFCKISGMVTEADPKTWTIQDIRPYFDRVLELFGPSRLMFGSDWPVCLLAGNYSRIYNLASSLVSDLSPSEQADFWSYTPIKVYRL